MADLRGAPLACPMVQKFLDFMQFFGNFNKIVCLGPLLQRILDPPLGTLPTLFMATLDEFLCCVDHVAGECGRHIVQ